MLEIVKLFQDAGSVDELGIGTVRYTFANALFPATSVLHTRARFLHSFPWLIRDVPSTVGPSDAAALNYVSARVA